MLLQASRLESMAGHYRAARELVLRAHAATPSGAADGLNLLQRLQAFHLHREVLAFAAGMSGEQRAHLPLLDAVGTVLNQMNQPEQALAWFERGLALQPDSPALRLSRAHTLMFLGRFDEAEADLARCLPHLQRPGFAWWLRAKLRRRSSEGDHVEALRRLLDVPGLDAQETVFLAFALHNELDAVGDHAAAAQALDLACRTQRARLDYSTPATRTLFEQLMAFPARAPGAAPERDTADAGAPVPVFIVGMHRSGTTLLEQLLDAHPDIRGLGELHDFTSQLRLATDHNCKGVLDAELVRRAHSLDFAALGRGYLDAVAWRLGGESHFTDKLPSNFLNIGFICQALPGARILHLVRDPMETGFSNLRELFADGTNEYSYDQRELGEFYRLYRTLMAHWHRLYPGRILDVRYERLTGDTAAVLREVSAFCGLDFVDSMAEPSANRRSVTTASAVQVRAGIGARDTPKWAPYAEYLAPLAATLRE